ncbi:glycogen debranching protein [Clostridium polyendosporum]|uniref:Glycogen debranching protein n=1 Tax=Clostridium polyendosporum TaxID=69208 RepID=A0A919VKB0_9CLOT|nr:amylo-alpha-1,6-glucosidase [Clostridium polyendosporum]GIM27453.1 glycogen debranching protein [Clostridium polyendosporum]
MELAYKLGRGNWRTIEEGNEKEWLIGNGIGGYSGHTIVGGGFRSFHGYLIAAMNPPVERYVVLTRTQEQIIVDDREYDLTSQQYVNYAKNGQQYLQRFIFDSVPQYIYQVEDINIKKTISMEYGHNTVVVCYEVKNGNKPSKLNVVPLLNFRYAGETTERSKLNFDLDLNDNVLKLVPHFKKDITINLFASEGEFVDRALRPTSMATPNYLIEDNHYYGFDNRNGSLGLDNHYTPYDIQIELQSFERKKFYIKCTVEELNEKDGFAIIEEYKNRANKLMEQSGYKNPLALNLAKAADHFIVNRKSTGLKTVLAGFPWFTDWGRDTMIAFEGLTLCTKRFDDAREILESFVKYIKKGLVPNVFPDKGSEPQYNTVDASLWYIHAVYQYLKYTGQQEDYSFVEEKLYEKMIEIIKAYATSTDFSIGMDEDGLVHAGGGLDQVTWMDVRVGDFVVTPRHGKPVEVNALWYNALCIMKDLSKKFSKDYSLYEELSIKVKKSFNNKFWNEKEECLFDVVDENDSKIRPNQIWAVSLPFTMLDRLKEKKIVDKVYKELYSTYGLRSLTFKDIGFKKQYIGKLFDRDCAYHMGTTWVYPIGAFISAYCKVNDHSTEAIARAKEMCEVFEDHMSDGCINGIAEIFDGEFTSTSRGCFTQAWSVAEVLRAYTVDVLPYCE